jgi:hypothetical protein
MVAAASQAVQSGRVPPARLREAPRHIMGLKAWPGLLARP